MYPTKDRALILLDFQVVGEVILDHAIALARAVFEAGAVEDGDLAAGILDEVFALKDLSRNADS